MDGWMDSERQCIKLARPYVMYILHTYTQHKIYLYMRQMKPKERENEPQR